MVSFRPLSAVIPLPDGLFLWGINRDDPSHLISGNPSSKKVPVVANRLPSFMNFWATPGELWCKRREIKGGSLWGSLG